MHLPISGGSATELSVTDGLGSAAVGDMSCIAQLRQQIENNSALPLARYTEKPRRNGAQTDT
jgi:hypothetical protein